MTRALAFLGRFAVTAALLALAFVVGTALWDYYLEAPWTRDGRVRAEVVGVAPDVSGLVRDVEVHDNQEVKRGDVLFRIDPDRFALALRQAEAVVAGRKASLVQAEADLARYRQLSDNVVSQQKLEAALATEQSARAAHDQAVADRDLARLNLARSEVRASVGGRISNLELRPGAYVAVGKPVMALVDGETLHVQGYFEETKLGRIHPGDPVTVQLMGEDRPITGRVESIAAGIEDRERGASASLLANVNPTFAWVRLAQRVPVRVALDPSVDRDRLTVGRTATVVVHPGGERPEVRPFQGLRPDRAGLGGAGDPPGGGQELTTSIDDLPGVVPITLSPRPGRDYGAPPEREVRRGREEAPWQTHDRTRPAPVRSAPPPMPWASAPMRSASAPSGRSPCG